MAIRRAGAPHGLKNLAFIWLAGFALIATLSACGSSAGPAPGDPQGPSNAIGGNRIHPGTLFVRGIVVALSRTGFSFSSPTKGSFIAVTSPLTEYEIKGVVTQPASVVVGTHVGVHGYRHGSRLVAVKIAIYPSRRGARPKEKTYRGTVIAVSSNWIDESVSGKSYHFDLAPNAAVIYRYLPTALTTAKVGQRVDVRAYVSGTATMATRVQLLVQKLHHPRTVTEYGTVFSLSSGGFTLDTTTGSMVTVMYPSASLTVGQDVSVHGWPVGSQFEASRVYRRTSLPVHTVLVRGIVASVDASTLSVKINGINQTFTLTRFTHVTQALTSHRLLEPGLYVSVRSWWQGPRRVATSVHIYKSIPVPTATGEVIGRVNAIHRDLVSVGSGGHIANVRVPSTVKIRDGAHRASSADLRVGQTISVRYYAQAGQLIATSIHIYVSGVKSRTRTGTIISVGASTFTMLDRGVEITVKFNPAATVSDSGKLVPTGFLKIGMRVRTTGIFTSPTTFTARRIDVLTLTRGKTGRLPQAYRGVVESVSPSEIVVALKGGTTVSAVVVPSTKLFIHNRQAPMSWLFPGPTAAVSVTQGSGSTLTATEIQFHPVTRAATGNISAIHATSISLETRTRGTILVDLTIAIFTNNGAASSRSAMRIGLRAAVDGFVLPDGTWAALSVAISYPNLRISGTVTSVSGQVVSIQRTSGAVVVLHFPAGFTVTDNRTGLVFQPPQIPLQSKLSIQGTQEAGWVLVKSAVLTLKSTLLHGTVMATDASDVAITLTLTSGTKCVIHSSSSTKFTIGHDPASFADVEVGDSLSIRAYPDPAGGVLASSVDIQRLLRQRTGFISDLSSSGFVLIPVHATESPIQINLEPYTSVLLNGQVVPLDNLVGGEKVKVEGHVRPDGSIDATKITIEG